MKLNRFFRDKKGEEKYLSIWWFFILAIVGLGVVIGVTVFYSAEVNVKEVEADILNNKLLNCFSKDDLANEFLREDFDIFSECDLSKEAFMSDGDFYFEVSLVSDTGELEKEVSAGNSGFRGDCAILGSGEENILEAPGFPRCVEDEIKALYFDEKLKSGKIRVFSGSNQKGEKIEVTQ